MNFLADGQGGIETVLIAPAVQPGKILRHAFEQHGVPRKVYQKLILDLEHQYGYSLLRDSPHKLARQITSRVLIVHDQDDRTTPYSESKKIAEDINHVVLHTTAGLGHKRILSNPEIVDLVQAYILERCGGRQV
jgi:pimeloyl-ACP methyl ester carboxylesterase